MVRRWRLIGYFLILDTTPRRSQVLLAAARGTVRAHTMPVAGGVLGITPFHNANCPFGFIYAAGHGALQFAQLPAKVFPLFLLYANRTVTFTSLSLSFAHARTRTDGTRVAGKLFLWYRPGLCQRRFR
jgi:hypothetical protein